MIVSGLLELIGNLLDFILNIVPIPGTPQFITDGINTFCGLIAYVMPIGNFLFGHTMIVILITFKLSVLACRYSFRLGMWVYGLIRGHVPD